jgi:hypothetical protein
MLFWLKDFAILMEGSTYSYNQELQNSFLWSRLSFEENWEDCMMKQYD